MLQDFLTYTIDATITLSAFTFTVIFISGLLPQPIQPAPTPQYTPEATEPPIAVPTVAAPIDQSEPAAAITPDYNSMTLQQLRELGTSRAVVPCDRRRRNSWVTALQTADHNDAVLLGATAETLGLL